VEAFAPRETDEGLALAVAAAVDGIRGEVFTTLAGPVKAETVLEEGQVIYSAANYLITIFSGLKK